MIAIVRRLAGRKAKQKGARTKSLIRLMGTTISKDQAVPRRIQVRGRTNGSLRGDEYAHNGGVSWSFGGMGRSKERHRRARFRSWTVASSAAEIRQLVRR